MADSEGAFKIVDNPRIFKHDSTLTQADFVFPRDGWCHAYITVLIENNNGSCKIVKANKNGV
jgi:hypothetical protein